MLISAFLNTTYAVCVGLNLLIIIFSFKAEIVVFFMRICILIYEIEQSFFCGKLVLLFILLYCEIYCGISS